MRQDSRWQETGEPDSKLDTAGSPKVVAFGGTKQAQAGNR
jgi:hypothetical protein